VGKKLIIAIENNSKHEELVRSQEGESAGGGELTFGIDWGILHICMKNYQVLMMGEGWGKKVSESFVTGREDMNTYYVC